MQANFKCLSISLSSSLAVFLFFRFARTTFSGLFMAVIWKKSKTFYCNFIKIVYNIRHASVAQWIEQWPPEPRAEVRFLSDAFFYCSDNSPNAVFPPTFGEWARMGECPLKDTPGKTLSFLCKPILRLPRKWKFPPPALFSRSNS